MRIVMAMMIVSAVLLCGIGYAQNTEKAPETIYEKGMVLFKEAQELDAEKKYDEGLAAWLKLADEYPTHQYARHALNRAATLANGLKKYDQSVTLWERFAEATTDGAEKASAYYAIGSLYYGQIRDYAKGGPWYEKAAGVPGYSNADVAMWQGLYCYNRAKEHDKVLAIVDKFMTDHSPKGSYGMQMLSYAAQAQMTEGDMDGAAATVEKMTALGSTDYRIADLHYRLGNEYRRKKDDAKAAAAYVKAAELGAAYDRGAVCLVTAGDVLAAKNPEEALKLYRQYVEEYPKGQYAHEVYMRMARVCQNYLKDRAKEITVCEEFLKKYGKSVYRDDILMQLAAAAQAVEGNQEKQIDALQQVVDLEDRGYHRANAVIALARIQRTKKDNVSARKFYEIAIKDYAGWQVADVAAREMAALK